MTITVRLIFWGLIGFVPNPNGEKGLTSLIIDSALAQKNSTVPLECQIDDHLAAVYLFKGRCDGGDCERIPANGENDALSMGFSNPLHGRPLPLRWLLQQEDLDIVGDESKRLRLRKPMFNFSRKIAPRNQRQARYFSWLQSVERLTGGQGVINQNCVKKDGPDSRESPPCPINARFNLQGGRVGSCHIVHKAEPLCSHGGKCDARIFDFEIPGRGKFQSAVADAMAVDLEIEGDSVLLLSKPLPGKKEEQSPDGGEVPKKRSTAWARLRPDTDGKLTLVIVNFPRGAMFNEDEAANGHSHVAEEGCVERPHSDLLYDLLNAPPESRARRSNGGIEPINPGSCELEAADLRMLLANVNHEIPHSTSACDGASIP